MHKRRAAPGGFDQTRLKRVPLVLTQYPTVFDPLKSVRDKSHIRPAATLQSCNAICAIVGQIGLANTKKRAQHLSVSGAISDGGRGAMVQERLMSKLSLLFAVALFVCPMTNSLWAQERAAPSDPYAQLRPYPDEAQIAYHWAYSCPNRGGSLPLRIPWLG